MKRRSHKEIQEYAIYKGEEIICMGTAKEIAKKLNIKPKTVQFLSTPAYLKRVERKRIYNCNNCMIAVKLNDVYGRKEVEKDEL